MRDCFGFEISWGIASPTTKFRGTPLGLGLRCALRIGQSILPIVVMDSGLAPRPGMTVVLCWKANEHHNRNRWRARQNRLDQTGAGVVRSMSDCADRDAVVLACGVQPHRQSQSRHLNEFRHAV